MSFECDECHMEATGVPIEIGHFRLSFGPCETCGRTRTCAECHCRGDWRKAREAAKEKKG